MILIKLVWVGQLSLSDKISLISLIGVVQLNGKDYIYVMLVKLVRLCELDQVSYHSYVRLLKVG